MNVVCSLCGRPRAEVRKLVQGEAGALCDECVGHALAKLEGDATHVPGWYEHAAAALGAVLDALPRKTALEHSEPLFRALLELLAGDADALRGLAGRAWPLGQYAMALEIFAALPEGSLAFGDRVERADALYHLDRFDDALAELEPVDESVLEDGDRAALWSLRAAATSRLPWPDLQRAEPAIDAAEAIIAASAPEEKLDDAFRAMLSMARIRLALAAERPDLASPLLVHLDPNFAEPALVIGDVHAALGDFRQATAAFERAREAAHPESALARAATERLGLR